MTQHLRENVGDYAETVEADLLAGAGDAERSPADQPGAEEKGELDIVALLAEWEGEARIDDRCGCEASVRV